MALLKTVAIKVKHSPQIIRKTLYNSSPSFYRKVRQNCRKGKLFFLGVNCPSTILKTDLRERSVNGTRALTCNVAKIRVKTRRKFLNFHSFSTIT